MRLNRLRAQIYLICLSILLTGVGSSWAEAAGRPSASTRGNQCRILFVRASNAVQGASSSKSASQNSSANLRTREFEIIEAPALPNEISRSTGESVERAVWAKDLWRKPQVHYQGLVLYYADYVAIRDASFAVSKIAGDVPILAIGRSPAPVAAFLTTLGVQSIATLPISSFRHRLQVPNHEADLPDAYKKNEASFEALSSAQMELLFEHFDRTILKSLAGKTGKVFLLDLGESGASVFSMQQYLRAYSFARKLPVDFETIVMTNEFFSSNVDQMARYFGAHTHKLVLNENKYVADSLKNSPWDKHAEFNSFEFDLIPKATRVGDKLAIYSSWDGWVDLPMGEPNERYARLRTAIHANMLSDNSVLDRWPHPRAFNLHLDGLRWDSSTRTYRDAEGQTWQLRTGD